ncbi:MAG: Holliday junction branch migration protein RuvA [Chitinophagales bacterium]
MFAFLRGKYAQKSPAHVIVDCNGVGYYLNISLNTYTSIQVEKEGTLFTYFHVTENSQALYGFSQESERELFIQLISISGVGPSTAILALSSSQPEELIQAIASSDVAFIKKIKGIGPKTAQRIILELKDKLGKLETGIKVSGSSGNTLRSEALSALIALGINRSQAEKTIDQVMGRSQEPQELESIVKQALKSL